MQNHNTNQSIRIDAQEHPSTSISAIINNSELLAEELKTESDNIIATKPRASSDESPAIVNNATAFAVFNASTEGKHSQVLTGAELESITTASEEEFKDLGGEEGKQNGERAEIVIARIKKQFIDWR